MEQPRKASPNNPFRKRTKESAPADVLKQHHNLRPQFPPELEIQFPELQPKVEALTEKGKIASEEDFWGSPQAAPIEFLEKIDIFKDSSTHGGDGFYSNHHVAAPNPIQSQTEIHFFCGENPGSSLDVLFSFKGRINRATFWLYSLATIVVFSIFSILGQDQFLLVVLLGISIWINFALCTKRYHDLNKSGLWTLLSFIPIAGIWVLIETGFFEGQSHSNQYGPPT